jgi:hypothetical protein
MLVDHGHDAPVEVEPHQRRLATLPGDGDLGRVLRFDGLLDVRLHHFVRHPERAVWIELLLRQEEAVGAVKVADGAGGLCHHVECLQAHRGFSRLRRV